MPDGVDTRRVVLTIGGVAQEGAARRDEGISGAHAGLVVPR